MLVRQKATMVARSLTEVRKDRRADTDGGNDMYVSLCRKHYNDGRIETD